jgi:hypothetical protein
LQLDFIIEAAPEPVALGRLVIAGWTGRDRAKMAAHIAELAALGVPAPRATPVFYRIATARLTQAAAIEVAGAASSGEAEVLLLRHRGRLLVGLASDHTDRALETQGITLAKQLCDKPVGPALWAYESVHPHWDQLRLRAWIVEAGAERLYQDGTLAEMLHPDTLLAAAAANGETLEDGTAMLCGTLPALGGIRPATEFRMELYDPVLKRTLSHRYAAVALPIRG